MKAAHGNTLWHAPLSPRLKKQQMEAYMHEKSGIYLYF